MIEQVNIRHFTVLEDFSHNFSGHHTLICGQNAIGKSSVLKFIQIALGATDCIAPGIEAEGEVYKNQNGQQYKFSVKMDKGKPKVTVTGPDGMSDSRKGVIASITGAMNLNIAEFINMSKSEKGRKEQVELFKSFFPLETVKEIERLEANVKTAFDDRTQLNKDIKQKDAEVNANPLNYLIDKELDKFLEVDISAAMVELKGIQEANAVVQRTTDNRKSREAEIVAETKAIAELQAKLDAKIGLQKQADEWLEVNKIKETNALEETIKNATKSNNDFKNAQKLMADKKMLEKMVSESESATVNIESQRQAIQDAIKDMAGNLVPGLTFDNNGLIYNGLTVHPDTHSTSERIKLGMRIKIAQNREIGVLFLESLESVDENGMKAIIELADELGMQVIGEEVRRNQKEMIFEIIGN